MKFKLLPIGAVDRELITGVMPGLAREFAAVCDVSVEVLDPKPMFHWERQQYHSSEILAAMKGLAGHGDCRVLGIAEVDFYIPILTFVFGEAQMGGPCAVVSTHRLRQEFYGLPSDHELLRERLEKEAIHELGHTFDLVHCENYDCVMSASHAVEWIDLKGMKLCMECRRELMANTVKAQKLKVG